MTPAEFCLVMAITIEQAGAMPDWRDTGQRCDGLCDLFRSAAFHELIHFIERTVLEDLMHRLSGKPDSHRDSGRFYWPRGDWPPRARMLRRMARELSKA